MALLILPSLTRQEAESTGSQRPATGLATPGVITMLPTSGLATQPLQPASPVLQLQEQHGTATVGMQQQQPGSARATWQPQCTMTVSSRKLLATPVLQPTSPRAQVQQPDTLLAAQQQPGMPSSLAMQPASPREEHHQPASTSAPPQQSSSTLLETTSEEGSPCTSSTTSTPTGASPPRSGSVQGATPPPTPASIDSAPASSATSPRSSSPSLVPTLQQPSPTIIPSVVQPTVQRSGRYALAEDGTGVTDEDVMQRAMRRKAEINLDTAGTKHPSKSFTSFSNSRISSNLSTLGVSLGNTSDEISVSVDVLRQTELDRLTVVPNVSTGPETSVIVDDEEDDILDGQLLSAIIGNISEVDLEYSELSSVYDLKASARGSRSSAGKKSRRYCKSSKSKIVSQ
nr:uncharacterized protein LOC127340034 [Lolium perenne]